MEPQQDYTVTVTEEDLDALAPSTICDRCSEEVPLIVTSAGLEAWSDWAGATLCPDCWSEVEADQQKIDWQEWKVAGGLLSRNAAGQFVGSLELATTAGAGWLTLTFVFDRSGAKWGWRPAEPEFTPDYTEE